MLTTFSIVFLFSPKYSSYVKSKFNMAVVICCAYSGEYYSECNEVDLPKTLKQQKNYRDCF